MLDQALVGWLERREEAWRWLVAFPRSHRETVGRDRWEYDERSRAFCLAEDAILMELRRRGEPFVYDGRRYSANPNGLVIEPVADDEAQGPAEAKGGAA